MVGLKHALLALLTIPIVCHAQNLTQPQQSRTNIVKKSELVNQSLPAGTHLNYYGGPVISNVQVVVVYWGQYVNSTLRTELPDFYRGVTKNAYFDLLSEYSTNFPSGTQQSIGRGSFITAITINPSISTTTIKDAQIQAELIRQISIGNIPQPKEDLAGNASTEYMVYFPPGVVIITQDGQYSCFRFCGYHGAVLLNGKFVPYGVIPDFGAGSGCDSGCGTGTELQNVMSVSSHELAESVTDTEVNQAASLATPLAWYDPTFQGDSSTESGAEIGDICAAQPALVSTPAGYITVQREFSNALGACVYSGLHPLYQLSGPSSANVGSPFNLALTVNNPVAGQGKHTSFVGTVHFTSSDASALVPEDYAFAPEDGGFHNFSVTLRNNGTQTITATDTVNGAITAKSIVTGTSQFSISATPASLGIPAEDSSNISIVSTIVNGISQSVQLSVTGSPAGAGASFAPAIVSSGQSSTLTINTGAAAPGSYQLTVTGAAGVEQHTTQISLSVMDRARGGDLRTSDSADRLSWTYEPNAVSGRNVEFKICKVPAITWWKEFVVRSGNFVLGDFGVKDSMTCTSRQLDVSNLKGGFQMELWKAKFLGIPYQVKVMPADTFGYLAPGSRITVTWLKD